MIAGEGLRHIVLVIAYVSVCPFCPISASAGSPVDPVIIPAAEPPPAPVASAATNVQSTGFCANWSAVPGALHYVLDVFRPNEDFNDDDFTTGPVWQGDTNSFGVVNENTLPDGNAATDGHFVASMATADDSALLVPSTETSEWVFSLAGPDLNPSALNHFGAVLMADSAFSGDIADANFHGYYLRVGDSGSDRVSLYRKTGVGSSHVGDFNTPSFSTGGLRDGLNIRVARDTNGVFELFYSTGFSMTNLPAAGAGTLTNAVYSSSSWFGIYGHFSSPDPSRRVYADNIMFGKSPNCAAGYASKSVSATSDEVTGLDVFADYYYRVSAALPEAQTERSNLIHVRTLLAAPTALAATAVREDGFTANWEPLNGALSYRLDVYEMYEDFTDGDFTAGPAWDSDTAGFEVLTAAIVPWGNANTDGSYLGSRSDQGHVALSMATAETNEWRFSLASPDFDASSVNNFGVVLMASARPTGGIAGSDFQGYYLAVGRTSGSDDTIELWRKTGLGEVKVGDFNLPDLDPGALRDGVNLRVTRDADGVFKLWYSVGFRFSADPETYAGSLTNTVYGASSYFAVFADFANPSASRRVYVDNITFGGKPAGYDNLPVSGTSRIVSGLKEANTYLYQVRALLANGATGNSNVIVTQTLPAPVPPATIFKFR